MTTTIAHEASRRRDQMLPPTLTFASDLERSLRDFLVRATTVQFPSPRYRADPVAFFHEVLGFEPWSRQLDIINAVRDNARVAVCSGHKVGKSASVAGLALWFYCSFTDARVVMSSTTARQVDQILWRELRMMRARAGRCVACKALDPEGLRIPKPCPHSAIITGEQGELARTGLKADDFREIVGFTAREAEAIAGISGRSLLYLIDEASGVPDDIFEAIEGNRAGGAKLVLVGNGTRNEGEFFEAFHSKSHLYFTMRISSEQTPNALSGDMLIPGLATQDWIAEKKLEWGEDSPLYRVRVKGEHALREAGRIFSLHMIGEAEARWAETPEAGRLYIGLDPAGESGTGDETVYVARRGLRMIALRAYRGLRAADHLTKLLELMRPPLRLRNETPVVVVDQGGSIGAELCGYLRSYEELHPTAFELVTIRPSDRSVRLPKVYHTMRDALAGNLHAWFLEGGAILEDPRLAKELHAFEWTETVRGHQKLTPKDQVRKLLGRSPDRYDALALSCWEPRSLREDDAEPAAGELQPAAPAPVGSRAAATFDPYAGRSWTRR